LPARDSPARAFSNFAAAAANLASGILSSPGIALTIFRNLATTAGVATPAVSVSISTVSAAA
jgi:hypothetical protein